MNKVKVSRMIKNYYSKMKIKFSSGVYKIYNNDIWYNVEEVWFKNKKYHRDYNPFMILKNNDGKLWAKDGLAHREDGPSVEYEHRKEWHINGMLHREDGPAIECIIPNYREWWLHGKRIPKKNFKKK